MSAESHFIPAFLSSGSSQVPNNLMTNTTQNISKTPFALLKAQTLVQSSHGLIVWSSNWQNLQPLHAQICILADFRPEPAMSCDVIQLPCSSANLSNIKASENAVETSFTFIFQCLFYGNI